MENETQDAKPVAESSTVTDDKPKTDASSAPATSKAVQSNEPTMADVIQGVVDKAAKAEVDTEKGERIQDVNPSEKEPSDKEEPTGKEKQDEAVDEKPPFHEHPAWKRVINERDEAREALKAYEADKPVIEKQKQIDATCREYNINLPELLDVAIKMQTEPAEAYKVLKPIVDSLAAFTNDIAPTQLPKDLQEKVKEGVLDPETAAELFRLRSEKARLEKRGEMTVQQQQMQHVAVLTDAMNRWDEDKRRTDPDFEKKIAQVQRTWVSLYNEKDSNGKPVYPVRTPQDAVALCEKAYEEVTKLLTSFLPPKPARRALNSTGASTTNPNGAPAKTMQEHVSRVIKEKHGIG